MAEETSRQQMADYLQRRKDDTQGARVYWLNIKKRIHFLNNYYLIERKDVHHHGLDLELRQLWEDVIQAAKEAAANDELSHYRLVSIVAGARASGVLKRPRNKEAGSTNGSSEEEFMTSDGVLWTDLPFFRPALYNAWEKGCKDMGAEAWTNLNKFAALLTGVNAINLLPLGLWTIRLALEEGDPVDGVNIEDLLPAAVFWFKHPSHILYDMIHHRAARASIRDGFREDFAQKACEIGSQPKDREVLAEDLSISRWEFWKRRLLFLSKLKDDAGERELIAQPANEAYTLLNSWSIN